MEYKQIFLGRQPILDQRQRMVAFELLFRSTQGPSANVTDDVKASVDVILNALCGFGFRDVLGRQKGFINVDAKLLLSDSIELLPKDQVAIELLETIEITPAIIDRCRQLKTMGFSLILDDFVFQPAYEPLLEIVSIVKIDMLQTPAAGLPELVKKIKRPYKQITLLAEKVEDVEQFNRCMTLGFGLFQGYYFAKPVVLNRKRIDMSKMTLIKLLQQVLSDAETRELEETFKQNPNLTYNLLRLVNSVAMGLKEKVSSVHHAIVLIGRQQLKRWIQLLLFTQGTTDDISSNPLLQMAAVRGKMMELLVQSHNGRAQKDNSDQAFMTGILSLLDTLLNIPMAEVLEQICLGDDVSQALLAREGSLGKLLLLTEKLEQADFASAETLLKETNLELKHLMDAQVEAIKWTNNLSNSL